MIVKNCVTNENLTRYEKIYSYIEKVLENIGYLFVLSFSLQDFECKYNIRP